MKRTSPASRFREDCGEVTRLFDDRPCGRLDSGAHLVGDDVGQSRLAESGRSEQKNVIERLVAVSRSRDRDLEVLLHLGLSDVFAEKFRTEGELDSEVVLIWLGGEDPVFGHRGHCTGASDERRAASDEGTRLRGAPSDRSRRAWRARDRMAEQGPGHQAVVSARRGEVPRVASILSRMSSPRVFSLVAQSLRKCAPRETGFLIAASDTIAAICCP